MRPSDVQHVGVWRALGEFRLKDALWPEATFAAAIGAGGATYAAHITAPAERMSVVADLTPIGAALIAVIFTALAIVVSLPSDSYLRLLAATPSGGMRRFLDPFLIAVGTQVLIVLASLVYRLGAAHERLRLEQALFIALGFLFTFGLLDLVALARQLVRHGLLRAANAELDGDAEKESQALRRLPGRRA